MTEKEKLMYKILGKISDANIPIVFKGALITKLILAENGFSEINRMTKDIDANYVGKPPTMSVLVNTINSALGELGYLYVAEPSRVYGEGRSAGISLKEKSSGDEVISMDIDIKPSIGSKVYYLGETSIKGVLANEILADKISTMSSDAVYKHRAKDIIDVFALSHCVTISTKEIFNVCQKANRKIDTFSAFFDRKADVEHAYNKLKGISGKPNFSEVYAYLSKFVKPFVEKDLLTDRIWKVETTSWQEVKEKMASMDDWKIRINEMKEKDKLSNNSFEKQNHMHDKGER